MEQKKFKPNDYFFFYLYWICERMNIFWKRYNGEKQPWTEDEILRKHKFTNVYRCLDRESQYLIKNVIYNDKGLNNEYDSEDIFWRIVLYKHFNKYQTWELLIKEFGDITLDIKFNDLVKFLDSKNDEGYVLYSNAYMMCASFVRSPKYSYLIDKDYHKYSLYFHVFKKELFEQKKIYIILRSKSLEELYNNIHDVTSFADFTSMQLAIDLNYSPLFDFEENEFVVAGLGAIRGIKKTFNDVDDRTDFKELIMWVQQNFDDLMKYYSKKNDFELKFKGLPGRKPSLIDLQNIFCETSKFLKGTFPSDKSGDKRIKQIYKDDNKPKIDYTFPPKWNIKL